MTQLATDQPTGAMTPLSFRVPAEFVELDLNEEPSVRLNRTFDELSQKLAGLSDTELLTIAMRQEFMAMRLVEEGGVYSGTCVARTDEPSPRLAVAQLATLVKDLDLTEGGALQALASGLRNPGDPRDVGLVDLPSGQALMVAEQVAVEFPSGLAGRTGNATSFVRQVQTTIPFPKTRKAAIFTLSSESAAGWQDFLGIFGMILKSVTFNSSSQQSVSDRLNPL